MPVFTGVPFGFANKWREAGVNVHLRTEINPLSATPAKLRAGSFPGRSTALKDFHGR